MGLAGKPHTVESVELLVLQGALGPQPQGDSVRFRDDNRMGVFRVKRATRKKAAQ